MHPPFPASLGVVWGHSGTTLDKAWTHRPPSKPHFQSGELIQLGLRAPSRREPLSGFGCWMFKHHQRSIHASQGLRLASRHPRSLSPGRRIECRAGGVLVHERTAGASAASQSLTYPLPHPVPELARGEHLDVRHPGKNPPGEFLTPGGREAHFQTAVPPLAKTLAGMPNTFPDVGGHLFGKEQPHLPRLLRLAYAKGVLEECPDVKASRRGEVLPSSTPRVAAGQGEGLQALRRPIAGQQVPVQRS